MCPLTGLASLAPQELKQPPRNPGLKIDRTGISVKTIFPFSETLEKADCAVGAAETASAEGHMALTVSMPRR